MYWKLFEEMYDAFALRQATEDLMEVRNAMLAGMYANPNLDDTRERRDIRRNAVDSLFKSFDEQVQQMRDPQPDFKLADNPFTAAMKVPEFMDTSQEAMVTSYQTIRDRRDIDIDQI